MTVKNIKNRIISSSSVGLTLALFLIVLLPFALYFVRPHSAFASPQTLFFDNFDSGDFTKWTYVDNQNHAGNWDITNADRNGTGSSHKKAVISGDTGFSDDVLREATSTAGYQNIALSYWYHIEKSLEIDDHVYVEWYDGANWNQIADYTSSTTGIWTQTSSTLPSSAANNSNFQIRFKASFGKSPSSDKDEFQLDDVSLTGERLPTLTLVKTVINDNGGTATTTDFQGKIDGANVPWGVAQTLTAGSHTASEVANVSGYAASSWGTDCAASGNITLNPGDNKTCTITNNDQPGILIVKKTVINDNGGTKNAADFSFQINNGTTTAFEAGGQNNIAVNAGAYSVSEPATAGYGASYDNCSNVVIGNGETKTCTITNDDIAPSLTLRKTVVNGDSGTATADQWTLTADAGNAGKLTGAGPAVASGPTFKAGTYILSESGPAHYSPSAWTCEGGVQNGSQITIGAGETATCSITNTFVPPGKIVVVKETVGDDGGFDFTGDLGDFSLTTNKGNASKDFSDLNPGTYSVSEKETPAGWQKTSAVCDNGNDPSHIAIESSSTVVCTFVNTKEGRIIVKKVVSPSDDQTSFSFAASYNQSGFNLSGGQQNDSGYLSPGSYNVSENSQEGWIATSTCDNGNNVSNINLSAGATTTCTFVNTKLGKITGFKFEDVNGNGVFDSGEPGLANVALALGKETGPADERGVIPVEIVALSLTGADGNFEINNVEPGNYKLFEEKKDGWSVILPAATSSSFTFTYSSNLNGQQKPLATDSFFDVFVAPGQTASSGKSGGCQGETCPLVPLQFGNWQDPKIIVAKWNDLNVNHQKDEGEQPVSGFAVGLGKETEESADAIKTEMVQLQLTGGDGLANLQAPGPGHYVIFEESKDNWQTTSPAPVSKTLSIFYPTSWTDIKPHFNVDSFFDVFVEIDGGSITHSGSNKNVNQPTTTTTTGFAPLQFGNVRYENILGGKFVPMSGDSSSSTIVMALGQTTINLASGGGTSTISLPDATLITRVDGGAINLGTLSAASVSGGALSGLGSGNVVDGALQWGITNLGLQFSSPITLGIFVGDSFNGQTLSVMRSVSGSGDWTSDGIVTPATCVVSGGVCSFSATKASYYAAYHSAPSSSGGGGGGGSPVVSAGSGGGGGGGGGGIYYFGPSVNTSASSSANSGQSVASVSSNVSPVSPSQTITANEITETSSSLSAQGENAQAEAAQTSAGGTSTNAIIPLAGTSNFSTTSAIASNIAPEPLLATIFANVITAGTGNNIIAFILMTLVLVIAAYFFEQRFRKNK